MTFLRVFISQYVVIIKLNECFTGFSVEYSSYSAHPWHATPLFTRYHSVFVLWLIYFGISGAELPSLVFTGEYCFSFNQVSVG